MQDLNFGNIVSDSCESMSGADISFDGLMEILKSEPNPFIPRSVPEGAGDKVAGTRMRMDPKAEEGIEAGEIIGPLELGEEADVGEDLQDILSALNDAQWEMKRVERKWQASETALREENEVLKHKLEDEAIRTTYTRSALEERRTRVASLEGEVEAALQAAKKEGREVEAIRNHARHEVQRVLQAFDVIVIATTVQQRKEEFDTQDLMRRVNALLTVRRLEQTKLQTKIDAVIASASEEKNKFDRQLESVVTGRRKAEECLKSLRNQLEELKRERDTALDALEEEKARVVDECEARLKTTTLLTAAQCKRRRLEYDLMVAGEEVAEEKLKMEQAHKEELGEAQRDSKRLKVKLVQSVRRRKKLEADLLSSRNQVNEEAAANLAVQKNLEEEKEKSQAEVLHLRNQVTEVQTAKLAAQKNLEEEKERSQCQICLENPKDSIAFPCLHMNFCFSCLEAHRTRNSTCPSCRTTITGVLKCVLGT